MNADAREGTAELLNDIAWAKRALAVAAVAKGRRAYPAELHRILHLVADSAIDADDAYWRKDADGLGKAISALTLNAGIAKLLSDAWRAGQ